MANFDEIIANANKKNDKTAPNAKPQAENSGGESQKKSYGERMDDKRMKCYAMSEDAALDAVSSPEKMQQLLDVQSRLERYSLNNTLLIYMQNPNATKIKDFDGWKEAGLSLKKGAKSIMILEPNPYTAADGTKRIGYNAKNVFDIADVADVPESEYPAVKQYDDNKLMSALINGCPVQIERTDANLGEDFARYDDSAKVIYYKQVGEFDKLFPAMAKAIAHADFAKGNQNYRASDYEFSARCAAYAVVKKYGRDTTSLAIHTIPHRYPTMEAEDIKKLLGTVKDEIKGVSERMNAELEPQREANKDKQTQTPAPSKKDKNREDR